MGASSFGRSRRSFAMSAAPSAIFAAMPRGDNAKRARDRIHGVRARQRRISKNDEPVADVRLVPRMHLDRAAEGPCLVSGVFRLGAAREKEVMGHFPVPMIRERADEVRKA